MSTSLFPASAIYRTRTGTTAAYVIYGRELNEMIRVINKYGKISSLDLANEMYNRKRKFPVICNTRTWTQQTVYAAMRILKEHLPEMGMYVVSKRSGYSLTVNRDEATESAVVWMQAGATMIETAKNSVGL
jgi:hypothetical protein